MHPVANIEDSALKVVGKRMGEALFGLHTETRKVWITIGVRPLVRRQTRYD